MLPLALLLSVAAGPARAGVTLVDALVSSVSVTAAESVSITCSGGKVQVTINATPNLFTTDCAAVTNLTVAATGNFNNDIELTGVTAALFHSLSAISIDGGGGADHLLGSELNDTASGGTGADTFLGQGGDDTFTWDPGDGSDAVNGGDGNDTLVFVGSNDDEKFTLNPDGTGYEFLRNLGNIDLAVQSTENFLLFGAGGADSLTVNNLTGVADLISAQLTMGEGADAVDASAQANAAVALTISGEAGDDILTGSPHFDIIVGGADNDVISGLGEGDVISSGDGNDQVLGGPGADLMNGGRGDDTLTWNLGDGSDAVTGDDGNDTLVFNGADFEDAFTLNPDGTGFEFLRDPGNVDMAVQSTENFRLFGRGGVDLLKVNDLTGVTDLVSAHFSMGDGPDIVNAAAQANAAVAMTISGEAGEDALTGSLNADRIDGGAGNDFVTGLDGDDALSGGDGNDQILGRVGADVLHGGGGDDTLVWFPGDGSDAVHGDDGNDSLVFIGSAANEVFTVSASAVGFGLTRDVGNIVMSAETTELLVLSALDGDDVVRTVPLPDTGQSLDGGGQVANDVLNLDPKGARVTSTTDIIEIEGAQPISFINFEQFNVVDERQVVNVVPPRSIVMAVLAAGALLTASFRLRRRRSR